MTSARPLRPIAERRGGSGLRTVGAPRPSRPSVCLWPRQTATGPAYRPARAEDGHLRHRLATGTKSTLWHLLVNGMSPGFTVALAVARPFTRSVCGGFPARTKLVLGTKLVHF